MNLYLIGFRGSGKTVLGKIISEKCDMTFIDTDNLTAGKEGISIPEIFKKYGEEYFRKIESGILEEISKKNNQVVSTGGGIILKEKNRDIIKKTGYCVFLHADPEILFNRIRGDKNRPALTGLPLKEEILEVLKTREPLYLDIGQIIVDTGKYGIEKSVEIILDAIKKKNGDIIKC